MIDFSYSKKKKATFKKLADKWDEIFQREDFFDIFTKHDRQSGAFINEEGFKLVYFTHGGSESDSPEIKLLNSIFGEKDGIACKGEITYEAPGVGKLSLTFKKPDESSDEDSKTKKYIFEYTMTFISHDGNGITGQNTIITDNTRDAFKDIFEKYGGESTVAHYESFSVRWRGKAAELSKKADDLENKAKLRILEEMKKL